MDSQERPSYIKGFNGLRALAVTLVFLDHKARIHSFNLSDVGVWTFFVLSGFLIIGELHRSRKRIEALGSGLSVRAQMKIFFTKRALRIFPIYYVVLAILLALKHFYRHAGPDLGFAYHFTYLSNFWIGLVTREWVGPFGVFWSLAIEQQFYLVAPFVFLMTRSSWHPAICVAVIVVGACVHAFLYSEGVNAITIYALSPWNFSILALGGLGAMLTETGKLRTVMRSPIVMTLGVVGVVYFCANALTLDNAIPALHAGADFGLTLCLAACVFWIVHHQESWITALLEIKPIAFFGVVSYGFYLVHNFIPNPIGPALALYVGIQVTPLLVQTVGVALDFGLSIFASVLLWKFVELPILALRKRAVYRQARDEAAVSSSR